MKFVKEYGFILVLGAIGFTAIGAMYVDLDRKIANDPIASEIEKSNQENAEYRRKFDSGMRRANQQVQKEGLNYEELEEADRYIKTHQAN